MAWDVTVTPDQVSIGVLVSSIPRDVIDVAVPLCQAEVRQLVYQGIRSLDGSKE